MPSAGELWKPSEAFGELVETRPDYRVITSFPGLADSADALLQANWFPIAGESPLPERPPITRASGKSISIARRQIKTPDSPSPSRSAASPLRASTLHSSCSICSFQAMVSTHVAVRVTEQTDGQRRTLHRDPAQLEDLGDVGLPMRLAAGYQDPSGVQTLRGTHSRKQCVLGDGLRTPA